MLLVLYLPLSASWKAAGFYYNQETNQVTSPLCPPYAHAHRRPVGVAGWQAMEPEERPLERSYEAAGRSSFFFPSENYDIGIFRNFRGTKNLLKKTCKKHVHKTEVARTVGHEVTLHSRYINPQSFRLVSRKNKLRSEMSCSLWMKM